MNKDIKKAVVCKKYTTLASKLIRMKINRIIIASFMVSALMFSCKNSHSGKERAQRDAADSAKFLNLRESDLFLLVGTYTAKGGSQGMYVYTFDKTSGKADSVSMAEVSNPSYLALSPDERFVYAVSEEDEKNSSVHAFSFDKRSGMLRLLNSQKTGGAAPCYVTADRSGRSVQTANYSGGSVSSFEVDEDGRLSEVNLLIVFRGSGPDSTRQEKPHIHSVRYSPDGRYLFASDLGTDHLYRFETIGSVFEGQPAISRGSLVKFSLPAGTGPRHFDFDPAGKYVYVLGELSGAITVFDYNEGDLLSKQTILADTAGARGSADIHVSPDGRFLYASNRLQADGIAIFSINGEDGTLTQTGYQPTGKHPRNFVITPGGEWLLVACRDENRIQVFRIDRQTGLLEDTQQDIPVYRPACLKFAGR